MNNLTIGKRITFGFAAVLIITFLLGGFALTRLKVIRSECNDITDKAIPNSERLGRVRIVIMENNDLVLEHILCTNDARMHGLEAQIVTNSKEIAAALDQCKENLDGKEAKDLFEKILEARANYLQKRNELIKFSYGATNEAQTYQLAEQAMDELQPLSDRYTATLAASAALDHAELTASAAQIQSAVRSSAWTTLIGVAGALLAGGFLAFAITRSTTRVLRGVTHSINDGAGQISAAAGQVSSASQTLAQGAGEHAAAIEETSSSLEEMASMTKRNAENARKANELAREARAAADQGVSDMQTMSTAMEAIKTSGNDIAKIIKTIDEIAFQTNILALNAAVEAARAGEAGMGFAVVADEVRNLAQRSAVAAKETAAKIEGAIANTAQGVDINGKVAEALNQIAGKVRQVDELINEVASASSEQTQGITQINTAIGQMDKVTQDNAASAEESASAAEELNSQATALKESVKDLLKLAGGADFEPGKETAAIRPVSAAATVKMTVPSQNGNGNHKFEVAARRNEIPLTGDFRDF